MENLCTGDINELTRIEKSFENALIEHIPRNGKFRNYVRAFIGDKFLNSYTNFSRGGYIKEGKVWNRIEYVESFNLNVCPYCNANFILTIKSDNQVARAEGET
ncbi:hypothetical protein KEH51_23460 [[Brevibacterium] frigoritolerans]|uniref:Uncharacterized protein n=1 Tax=Peribacillus frigoritolerans TaxID=450367 RepID=A0A941J7P3_9BACI|nr:hypothetical protein [Peribacillus frigoritolerans]